MKTLGEIMSGVGRGFRRCCPECGVGPAFRGYLAVLDQCPHCGHNLDQYPADDAPPYVSILLVGHVVVPLALFIDLKWSFPQWAEMTLWGCLAAVLTLVFLPFVKGAVIGFEWGMGIVREKMAQPLGSSPESSRPG